ncbi:MAG: DUF1573 domain-containing protein [Anaerolineales bacterium]
MNRSLPVALLVAALFLAGCGAGDARIALEVTEFDFGDVPLGDVVTRELSVRNTGTSKLVIESISTSCGCTTAAIDQTQIPPGSSTVLRVTFDSAAHGDVAGFYTRQVFLSTNDTEQEEITIEFTANVVFDKGN